MEKALKEHGDTVTADEKAAAEAALAELKTALEGGDVDAIKAASEKLGQASAKLSEAALKAEQAKQGGAGAQPGPQGGNTGTAGSDGDAPKAEDADFKVVD